MRLAVFTIIVSVGLMLSTAKADTMILDDFTQTVSPGWGYVADRVMGGVSNGQAQLGQDDGGQFVRLTGEVSTENNGGFIQVRRRLNEPLPTDAEQLSLTVKGNGERYYVFLRPREAFRPWYSYRASFMAGAQWREVTLNLSDFTPSHGGMPAAFEPGDIIGIGLVAYGADFQADLSVRRISVR